MLLLLLAEVVTLVLVLAFALLHLHLEQGILHLTFGNGVNQYSSDLVVVVNHKHAHREVELLVPLRNG